MSDNLSVDALWQMADDLECWFPSHNMARFANAMRDVSKERDWLRAEVERLTAALADERRHADALAEAAEMLDTHAVAIHDADGKCYSVSARDYARLFDALATHRAQRQG